MNIEEMITVLGVSETLLAFSLMDGTIMTEGMIQGLARAAERLNRLVEKSGVMVRIAEMPEAPDAGEKTVDQWVTINELMSMGIKCSPSTVRDKLKIAHVERRREQSMGDNYRMKSYFVYSMNDIREKVRSGKLKLGVQVPLDVCEARPS